MVLVARKHLVTKERGGEILTKQLPYNLLIKEGWPRGLQRLSSETTSGDLS